LLLLLEQPRSSINQRLSLEVLDLSERRLRWIAASPSSGARDGFLLLLSVSMLDDLPVDVRTDLEPRELLRCRVDEAVDDVSGERIGVGEEVVCACVVG
jgi:hypothetical protein